MQSPAPPTIEYSGPPPDSPEPRPQVALVGRSGGPPTDDLYQLLRRRLIIATLLPAVYFLGSMVILSLAIARRTGDEVEQRLGANQLGYAYARLLITLVATAGTALLLWRRPPRSVFGLRAVELLVLAVVVVLQLRVVVAPESYGLLVRMSLAPVETRVALFASYVNWQRLAWFAIIVVYGTIIPNTLRRCLVVAGTLALSPLVLFALYAFWLQPVPPRVAGDVLVTWGVWQALAVAVAAFSSSRIEYYRTQAAAARKLGQYVLHEKLGSGGMGDVYRAEHALLRRPCALKTIRPERAGDPDTLRQFEREVQITATLTHPNTVQIYDYGHATDGTFYYVMEYLPGQTLDELVKRAGPLPPARAVHLLRQVCAALQEAHERGLVHRDIKPGNVMVCARGGVADVAKLLDFGLVLPTRGESGDDLTPSGTIAGTPAYLSPEQAAGQDNLDARSDLYSLGALAYFLLTGRSPFVRRSWRELLLAHQFEEPEPPSVHRAGVPADLEAVVLRCLAKRPEERFADVRCLNEALAACVP